ncbi:MAG: rhodanese-like domain-containing protein [Acidimicrobiales bacterium]
MSAAEVRARLAAGEGLVMLDVREDEEVAEWSFPGSLHIPLGQLGARSAEIPMDRPVVVVCHAGVRSGVAAEALANAGWTAASMTGGALAWAAAGPERGSP